MFGWFDETTAEAAFLKQDDPVSAKDRIHQLVKRGFIVRTRADEAMIEARNHDSRRFEAALASGAQLISTDFYVGAPDPEGLGYWVDFNGHGLRRNPITAGKE